MNGTKWELGGHRAHTQCTEGGVVGVLWARYRAADFCPSAPLQVKSAMPPCGASKWGKHYLLESYLYLAWSVWHASTCPPSFCLVETSYWFNPLNDPKAYRLCPQWLECVMPKTSALMMLILIPAAEMGITVATVTLGQVRLAGMEVLMGAGCRRRPATPRKPGRPLCKPCSTCSTGQQNISGSIYFNGPNDTSISLKRNVKVKWFPLERKTLASERGFKTEQGGGGV